MLNLPVDQVGYHHFSLNFDPSEIAERFRDIRLVLIAGCWRRAFNQAKFLAQRLTTKDGKKYDLERLTHEETRFKLFKVGPVILSDHGMGGPSMSIAVHELLLMCREAQVMNRITMIRFGTCGGLGIEPGNICITDKCFDPLFNEYIELRIVGNIVRRPCIMDTNTIDLIKELISNDPNHEELGEYQVLCGATLASNDFYEEQGRTNGIICDHTNEDKIKFIGKAKENGVVNFEMESNYLAAMCHKLGVKFAIVCVTLVNRLSTDRVHIGTERLNQIESRLFWLNYLLARHKLSEVN